jgi:hypothetical protein
MPQIFHARQVNPANHAIIRVNHRRRRRSISMRAGIGLARFD